MRVVTAGNIVVEESPGIDVSVSKEFSWLDTTSDKFIHYSYYIPSGTFIELPTGDMTQINYLHLEGDYVFHLITSGTEEVDTDGSFQCKSYLVEDTSLATVIVEDMVGGTTIEVIMAGE